MDIIQEISQIKESYYKGTVTIMDGLVYSQYETIRKTEFYTNSQYLNGMFDEFGRYKPFYNIVNFRVNISVKATDLDTKDIQVFSENPQHAIKSMMFNKEVKNWMRETYFSKVLNEVGFTRAKYGGVLAKKVIKGGELCIEVPEWKNLITDPVDIENGVKLEKHYMTPVQLQKKRKVWNKIDENWEKVEKAFQGLDEGMYTNSSRVCVLEVEGEFEREYLENESLPESEKEEYSLQHYFILCDVNEKPVCVLHSEELKESSYMYLDWLKASGRGLGIGVVEDGFNAQFATNDSKLKERDILELATKTLIVTDSDTIENNIITDMQVGDMLKIEKGESASLLNLMPNSFPALDSITKSWDEQYSRISSTFEAVTGETMPSGTPFRAIAIQNQEAQSTFNYRREELGIFLNQMFTKWIIPHIAKKLSRSHILASDFTDDELMKIDEAFTTYTARQKVIEDLLIGKPTVKSEWVEMIDAQKAALTKLNKRRFIEVPDGYFKDVEFKLDIITTGEQINKTAVFETISNMIGVVAGNPAVLQDPILKALFAKAVELTGIGINIDAIAQANPKTPPTGAPSAPQEALQANPEMAAVAA